MDEPSAHSRSQLEREIRAWIGYATYGKNNVKRLSLLPKLRIVHKHLEELEDEPRDDQVASAVKRAFRELLPEDNQDWEADCLRILVRLDTDGTTAKVRRTQANEISLVPSDSWKAFISKYETDVLIPYLADRVIADDPEEWVDDRAPSEPRTRSHRDVPESEPTPVPPVSPVRDRRPLRLGVGLGVLLAILAVIGGSLAWRANRSSEGSGGAATPSTSQPVGSLCHEPPPDVAVGGEGSASSSDAAAPNGLTAQMGVANVSAGAKNYGVITAAAVDDVIKVQVRFENISEAAVPDLWLRLVVPPEAAANPRLTARLGGGGESVDLHSPVTLSLDSARLQLIPGSVKWRHNTAPVGVPPTYETTSLGDDVLFRNTPIENLPPGPDHAGTISALVRVVADRAHIEVSGRAKDGEVPLAALTAEPGEEVEQIVRLRNTGNSPLRGVVLLDNIPAGTTYAEASTRMSRTNAGGSPGEPVAMRDGIVDDRYPTGEGRPAGTRPGLPIGDVAVGETVELSFHLSVGADVPSGARLTNIALVSSPCTAYDHDESTILVV